ncbi:hypothetical protein DB30_07715 [Enhygromyxa salina]|uniref:Uncharacterized protein n=1 Tax=Enhygromyxa salina TaxID=215803 RepID=A0A0C2DBB3_9BACT|nr:hypothetical protein DB30_07715 [Enhygromyxa salina]
MTFVNSVMAKLADLLTKSGHHTQLLSRKNDVWLYKKRCMAQECRHAGK